MVVVWSIEGAGSSGEGDPPSLSSLSVIMTSGEKMGLIVVIPHVKNGGYMEVGAIQGLGWAVQMDVGIRQG